jgi:hypothetical protein
MLRRHSSVRRQTVFLDLLGAVVFLTFLFGWLRTLAVAPHFGQAICAAFLTPAQVNVLSQY